MRLLSLFCLMMSAPAAALAEPESLTLDCMASARASYSIVCSDPQLRALAAEERRLYEHHRTSGFTTPSRLAVMTVNETVAMERRKNCLGNTEQQECLAGVIAQQIIQHRQIDALPPVPAGLTANIIELACADMVDPVHAMFIPFDPPRMALSINGSAQLLVGRDLDTRPTYEAGATRLVFLSEERAEITKGAKTTRCVIR